MKKLTVKLLLFFSIFLFMSTSAMALNVYTSGDDYAWGDAYAPLFEPTGDGYYIWSNDSKTEWSIRWSGGDWTQGYSPQSSGNVWASNSALFTWWGEISYEGLTGNIDLVSWDVSDGNGYPTLNNSVISFAGALAGPHWDGFNFEIDNVGGAIVFNLFRSDDSSANVRFSASTENGDTSPVPEPATMLLLGSGLVGFAGLKRKAQKKSHKES